MTTEVLTLPHASKICAVSRWTLRDFAASGQLKAFETFSGHYRIYKSDLESFIRERNVFSVTKKVPRKKRILIVDDDSKIRKLLGCIFEESGYDIERGYRQKGSKKTSLTENGIGMSIRKFLWPPQEKESRSFPAN